MLPRPRRLAIAAAAAALALAAQPQRGVQAHSWIDCIDTDRTVVYDDARKWIYGGETSNGRCRGYVEHYPGRGDANINTKMTHKVLMDDVLRGAAPCPSGSGGGDAAGFPHLKVRAGEKFYYGYLDNGHTSKDKAGRGTLYGVYWTGEPGTRLESTLDLTDARLVDGALHDFDDGNCGQTYEDGDFSGLIPTGRAGNDYPCVGELAIPAGTKPGVYSLVWFWRFYNEKVNAAVVTTGGHFGGAAYSSCFQVEVLAGGNSGGGAGVGGGEVGGESKATSAPTETPAPVLTLSPLADLPTETPAPTAQAPAPTAQAPAPAPAPAPSASQSPDAAITSTDASTTAASEPPSAPPSTPPTTPPQQQQHTPTQPQPYTKKGCRTQRDEPSSPSAQHLRG